MTDIEIKEAPEVEEIALELIPKYHAHLAETRILYLKSDQDKRSKGKSIAADIRKFGPLDRFLSSGDAGAVSEGYDFLLMVYEPFRNFDTAQRKACVDHELCHVVVTKVDEASGEQTLGLIGHDVEEFAAVIQRHGLWNVEIREFENAARQMSLDGLMGGQDSGIDSVTFSTEGKSVTLDRNSAKSFTDVVAGALDDAGVKYERDARVGAHP